MFLNTSNPYKSYLNTFKQLGKFRKNQKPSGGRKSDVKFRFEICNIQFIKLVICSESS